MKIRLLNISIMFIAAVVITLIGAYIIDTTALPYTGGALFGVGLTLLIGDACAFMIHFEENL